MDFKYSADGLFDEMFLQEGDCREHYQMYKKWLSDMSSNQFQLKQQEADLLFHRLGITFNVYGEDSGVERLIPFDTVPRIIPGNEWTMVQAGVKQRVSALNHFLYDIYHDKRIIDAGLIPEEQVFANEQYQPCMQGVDLPGNIYTHIAGVDLIKDDKGDYYVLEDNLRTPSGVSYMLENRKMMMRLFPELFSKHSVASIDHYPSLLLKTLKESTSILNPCVVVHS
jgi:uncharacterized circularly permuted ATP-grasp superfamily protein